MLDLTTRARNASQQITIKPTIVFKIEGFDQLFTSAGIEEYIRVGDPGLLIGNDWVIGGLKLINGQSTYISFTAGGGTTAKLTQKIKPDRAQGSTISSMTISLVDKNGEMSQLISPGFDLNDVLGKNVFVSIGFIGTVYPDDYNIVFRGIISDADSGAGFVNLLLASAEDKKRRPISITETAVLDGAIGAGAITTLDLVDASFLPQEVNAPDGSPDTDIEYLVKIEDELFRYTTIVGNQLQGITRDYLGTIAVAHDDQEDVASLLRLTGNGIDIALKLMLSGINDYFATDVPASIFNNISISEPLANAVFFSEINVIRDYGLTAGDWITVSGASEAANNFTMRQISDIDFTVDGSFVTVTGAALTSEFDSSAVCSFRSKYDALGVGLKMVPNEVDVERHEFIRDSFVGVFNMDFQGVEISLAKDFIEKEIYLPMGCFSVPRQGKSSVTYTIGPLATNIVPILNASTVVNPQSLKVSRSISDNFINTLKYEFDFELEKFKKTKLASSSESKARIIVQDKVLNIASKGLRSALGANTLITVATDRMLGRYQFGAEFVNGIRILYGGGVSGYSIEIGDVVLVDYASLKFTDLDTGNRNGNKKYMEVINKTLDNKTGAVTLDVLNTSFEFSDRYALISPSSELAPGATTTRLLLKQSWGTRSYQSETKKWEGYEGLPILIHSPDWTYLETTTIKSLGVSPDAMIVDPPLSVAPSVDYIIEVADYPTDTDVDTNAQLKALHAYWSPVVDIVSASSQTVFIVAPADIGKFLVDGDIRINNAGFADYSAQSTIIAVDTGTNTVTIGDATGFTIDSTHQARLLGFADGGYSYRLL